MDQETLKSYDSRAAAYARDWIGQDAPVDMYELLTRFFRKGPTVDIKQEKLRARDLIFYQLSPRPMYSWHFYR